jgi:hypothetical protein
MIHGDSSDQPDLDNEEILEILEMINKDAFRQTEVFKVSWDDIIKSNF